VGNKIFHFLIVSLLFFLPFVYFPFGTSYWETPKVYVTELLIFFLLIVTIFQSKKLFVKKKRPLLICCGIIVCLSLYHLTFLQTDYTLWGNPFRMQGVLLLWFMLLFCYLASYEPFKRISPFLIGGLLVMQVILAFAVDSGSLGRAVGSIGEPNSLAGIMIVTWPFLYFSIKDKRWQRLSLVFAVILVGLIILLAGSRSGLVAFVIQILVFCGIIVMRWSIKKVVVICLFLLVCAAFLPFVEKGSVYENRGEVWQSGVVAGLAHPFLGNGFGNTEFALNTASIKLNNHLQGYYLDSAHNIFLDWWVQGGIVGVSVVVFLFYKTFATFIATKQTRNLIILLGLLAVVSFNPVSIALLIYLWWLIGQGN